MLEKGTAAALAQDPNGGSSLSDLFEQIKGSLRREIGDTAFRSWIQPIAPVSFAGSVLEIAAPTRFVRDWVKTHYADRIRALWAQQNGACARVECTVSGKIVPAAAFDPVPVANENAAEMSDPASDISSPLDPRFTFANFVTGPSNALAQAAAARVAEGHATAFNPLFLQGGVGLGKTHLMHATAWALRAKAPQRKVVYLSAEKFMYRFVQSLRAKDVMSFKEQFRGVDVLMVDDIQFICGKESTQQEFFHTFNALIDQGRQIILSADRAPAELEGIDERLRSRLGMGLVAQIQPATYEMRLEILQSKCALMKREVPVEVLVFLAETISSNVRELEGALNRLIAQAELVGREITLESAWEILADLIRAADRRTSIEDIQKKVAAHYGITVANILSPRRARPLARPRQVAMYLSKALTEHSLPEIGRKFGGRDHTTIIHGVRKIEELMTSDAGIRQDVEKLRKELSA